MASIDIDIDEVLWGLSRREQKEMLEGLLDKMDTSEVLSIIKNHKDYTPNQLAELQGDNSEFNTACAIIASNRWRLDLADEEYILKLANKL